MNEKNKDLIEEINVAAFFVAQRNLPYDSLCWIYAERNLAFKNPSEPPKEHNVKAHAAQVYFSCCEYDILCWMIAEIDILTKHKRFDFK